MSEKQIRLALHNLKTAGCIAIAPGPPTVDRTRKYGIQEAVYQCYVHIMTAHQFSLSDAAEPPAGGR
jgi:hypothetical protein